MRKSKKLLTLMLSCALALCSAGVAEPVTSVAVSADSTSATYDNTNQKESKASSDEPFQVFEIYDAYSAVMATTTTTTTIPYTTTTCTVATTDHKPGELKHGPLNGIDVSEHNGSINWSKVKNTGQVDFAIIRAGYGREMDQRDKRFDYNIQNAQANYIPCGVYWFSYALSPEEALVEAETCYSMIKDYNYQLPVYFDIETDDQWGLTAATCSAMCEVFCKYMQDRGYTAGIYSCASFLETKVYHTVRQKYEIWVAEYGHSVDHYTGSFRIWQHSCTGILDGIPEDVDLNYAYVNYPELLGKQMCAVDVNKPVAKGIDVYEGSGEINWNSVKKAGYSFGIVRAGSGYDMNAPDKLFEKSRTSPIAAFLTGSSGFLLSGSFSGFKSEKMYSSACVRVIPSAIMRSSAPSRISSGSLKRARACRSVSLADIMRSLIPSLNFNNLSLFERVDWAIPNLAAASDWDIPYSSIRRLMPCASSKTVRLLLCRFSIIE